MIRAVARPIRLVAVLVCAATVATGEAYADPTPRVFTNADLPHAAPPRAAAPSHAAGDRVIRDTGDGALAQPMIGFELRDARSGRPLAGDDTHGKDEEGLGALLGKRATAILDTGASAHLLSSATASYYRLTPDAGARYVETGMSGEHAMGVSRELGVALRDAAGAAPRVFASQRLLLNDAPTDLAALMLSPGALVDVIGMPAIREVAVVIDTAGAEASSMTVRLESSAPNADVWVPLVLSDFSQHHHPKNRGALPSLAANPIVEKVAIRSGTGSASGDWLFDTGAAVTMISNATGAALGLVGRDGKPAKPPSFTVPVGGISGGHEDLPGFRVDRIEVATADGRPLVFENAAVVVHDVTMIGDSGRKRTLDGVFGMNLLLPSGSGLGPLGFTTELPSPFARVIVDGPHTRLGLDPR